MYKFCMASNTGPPVSLGDQVQRTLQAPPPPPSESTQQQQQGLPVLLTQQVTQHQDPIRAAATPATSALSQIPPSNIPPPPEDDDDIFGPPPPPGQSSSSQGGGSSQAPSIQVGQSASYTPLQPRREDVTRPILNIDDIPGDVDDFDAGYTFVSMPPPEDEWNVGGFCGRHVAPDYTLNDLLKDMNGSEGFSEDRAALGTVLSGHFLQVTTGMDIPEAFVLGRDPFVDAQTPVTSEEYQRRVALFMYANYRALMDSNVGLSRSHAWFLVMMRLNMVIAGGTASSLEARAIYADEYHRNHMQLADIQWQEFEIAPGMASYVNSYWLQYVALVRHLFITRGHHYKDEYLDAIESTWTATTIVPPTGLSIPTWQHILRTALHCFGIRALHLLTRHAYANGKLAASFIVRFNAAAAGTAPIRTGWAAIENMKQATWWPDFYETFKVQVDNLEHANEVVTRLGVRGHINSKLLNWNWPSLKIPDTPVRPLAPYIMGFIDTLDRTESIKGQQAITKRADGGSAIRAAFAAVLLNERQDAIFLRSPREFFKKMEASRGPSQGNRAV